MPILNRKPRVCKLYRAIGGSVKGATHRHNRKPNQDSCSFPKKLEGPSLSVAISDGHGADEYVRSDFGSHAAAVVGRKALAAVFAAKSKPNRSAVTHELLTTHAPKTIHREWIRRVEGHLQDFPFSELELCHLPAAQELEVRRRPVLAYGCTLLAASVSETAGALVRIGDGTIAVMNASGELVQPFTENNTPGDDRTESLCARDATKSIETHFLDFSDGAPRCIVLATDGYTKSFASATDAATGLARLYEHVETHGVEDLERNFKEMLERTTESGSGDDTSVAMIVNLTYLDKLRAET